MKTIATEIRKVIERDGHYMVHIKKHEASCSRCYGQEIDPRCPLCLGLGKKISVHTTKVRSSYDRRPDFFEIEETPLSVFGSQKLSLYCLPEDHPSEGDIFIETTWSVQPKDVPTKGQVLKLHRVYEANGVVPQYGERAELCYFKMTAHDVDIDTSWLKQQLSNRPTR